MCREHYSHYFLLTKLVRLHKLLQKVAYPVTIPTSITQLLVRDQSRSASISLSHFPFSFITFLLHPSFSHLSIYWTLCSPFTCFPFIFMPCYHIAQPHDVIMMSSFMPVSSLFHQLMAYTAWYQPPSDLCTAS